MPSHLDVPVSSGSLPIASSSFTLVNHINGSASVEASTAFSAVAELDIDEQVWFKLSSLSCLLE
jgi:hypothetical protein